MSIQAIIFVTLAAVSCCSCHPSTGNVLGLDPKSIHENHSVPNSNCVDIAHRDNHSNLRIHTMHLRNGEISLAPPPPPPPYTKPDNSTKTNTTLPTQQPSPETPPGIQTLDSIITPIFRTVILILTLFNINITWRIHALHIGHRPLRHHNQPAVRGWPV